VLQRNGIDFNPAVFKFDANLNRLDVQTDIPERGFDRNAVYIMQYPGTAYKYMWQFIIPMKADCQFNKILVPTAPVTI
jgi:hypothetical protein